MLILLVLVRMCENYDASRDHSLGGECLENDSAKEIGVLIQQIVWYM